MGKKLEYTPNSKIKAACRQLFLRSRERNNVLKRADYRCSRCGVKRSVAKAHPVQVEVHHKKGVLNWHELYKAFRDFLLNEEHMEPLCKGCHKKEHDE